MPHNLQHTLDESRRIEQAASKISGLDPALGEEGTELTRARADEIIRASGQTPLAPPVEQPVVGSSASVRDELTKRGVDDADAFGITTEKTFDQFKKDVAPGQKPPEAPAFKDVFAQKRASLGIEALEDRDVEFEAEKAELEASLREFRAKSSKGVSQRTFLGRLSEEERAIQERIDTIERRQRLVQLKIKNKNSFLSDFMGFVGKDFEVLREEYEFDFNKNLQMQTAYQNYKSNEERRQNQVRDDARASLNTQISLIQKSGKSFAEFVEANPKFSAEINKLEAMGGIIVGSIAAFAEKKPNAKPIAITVQTDAAGNKVQYFTYADKDGRPGTVETVVLPGARGRDEKATQEERADAIADARTKFTSTGEFTNTSDYQSIRLDWVAANLGSVSEFDNLFASFLSPTDRAKLGVGKAVGVKAGDNIPDFIKKLEQEQQEQ